MKIEKSKLVYDNGYIKVYSIKIIHYSYDNKYANNLLVSDSDLLKYNILKGAHIVSRSYRIKFDNMFYSKLGDIKDINITGMESCVIECVSGYIYVDRCEAYDDDKFHYYHNGISNIDLERMEYQAHLKAGIYMLDKGYNNLNSDQYDQIYNNIYDEYKKMLMSNYECGVHSQTEKTKSKKVK